MKTKLEDQKVMNYEDCYNIFEIYENGIKKKYSVVIKAMPSTLSDNEKLKGLQDNVEDDFQNYIQRKFNTPVDIEVHSQTEEILKAVNQANKQFGGCGIAISDNEEIWSGLEAKGFEVSSSPLFCITPVHDGIITVTWILKMHEK